MNVSRENDHIGEGPKKHSFYEDYRRVEMIRRNL
jgi:hypothetical protein